MNSDTVEYYYKSALQVLKGARLFGEPVNINNYKEVIATLYAMWLNHDQLYKEKEREFVNELEDKEGFFGA